MIFPLENFLFINNLVFFWHRSYKGIFRNIIASITFKKICIDSLVSRLLHLTQQKLPKRISLSSFSPSFIDSIIQILILGNLPSLKNYLQRKVVEIFQFRCFTALSHKNCKCSLFLLHALIVYFDIKPTKTSVIKMWMNNYGDNQKYD